MPTTTIQFFAWEHLPAEVQPYAKEIAKLAYKLEAELPDSAEKSAGMRKLLEAKDCFIRTVLEAEGFIKKPRNGRKPHADG